MTLPLSAYRKVFDTFILESFPDIEYLEVEKISFPFTTNLGIRVNFHLRPGLTSTLSCNQLLELLRIEVGELVKYLGGKIAVDMYIIFKGEVLCNNLFGY